MTFSITVTLPESTTQAIIVDTLPTFGGTLQLDYVSSQVLRVGHNITGSLLSPGDPGVFDSVDRCPEPGCSGPNLEISRAGQPRGLTGTAALGQP